MRGLGMVLGKIYDVFSKHIGTTKEILPVPSIDQHLRTVADSWGDSSIRTKFLLIAVLIFGVAIANGGGILLFLQEQDQDAAIVNMAGQQRYRTAKMEGLTYQIAAGETYQRDELISVARQYNRTLTTMIHGDPARGIPPAEGAARDQLLQTRQLWRSYNESIRVVATEPRDSAEFATANEYVRTHSDELLISSDTAVSVYQRQYERAVTRFKRFQMALLLVIGGALLIIRVVAVQYVLRPVTELAASARAVATGDLDRPIETIDTDDEIGVLTGAVREMKDHLLRSLRDARGFKNAVENTGHGVALTDTEGRIEYVNPAFEQMVGYVEADVVGRQICDLRTGEDAGAENIWGSMHAQELWTGEDTYTHASGRRCHVEQTAAPITDEAGELEQIVVVVRDITDRKLKEQQLQVQNRALRHNLRNRTNVIGGHADSLLTVVDSKLEPNTQMLSNAVAESTPSTTGESGTDELVESVAEAMPGLEDGTARVYEHGETIRNGADDLEELSEKADRINDALGAARSGQSTVNICDILAVEQERFDREYPDAEITVVVPDTEISAYHATKTVLHEVIANALEHNDEPIPEVHISAGQRDGGLLEITVADNGPGISEYERQVIERGKETPLVHGSGLGLWLVRWLITSIGGTLSITKNESRGTAVTLTVPIASQGLT